MTCDMFGSRFCDQHPTNVHFQVVAKYFKLEITCPHETQVERIHILRLRSMTFHAIAFVVAQLIEAGTVKQMDIGGKHAYNLREFTSKDAGYRQTARNLRSGLPAAPNLVA